MKLFIVLGFVLLFTNASISLKTNFQKPASSTKKIACGDVPELNKKIIAYVKTNMGKRIGKGECWDVAAAALNSNAAKWNKKFNFGKEVNYKTDCIYPGDIMQLDSAMLHNEPVKGYHVYDRYPQHTAIVFEVKNKDEYILADQNFGFGKKYINTHPINLKNLAKGFVKFYRPVK